MKSRNIFIAALILILFFNAADLFSEILKIRAKEKSPALYFAGIKFSGLKEILGDVRYVGYYTDKDLNIKTNAAQFSQAQYVLAPIILDLNNTDHDFILFDCTTDEAALRKMRQVHALPFKKNQFGIYLARK